MSARLRRITYHTEPHYDVDAGDWLVHVHRRTARITYWEVAEAREGRLGPCERHEEDRELSVGQCQRWGLWLERRDPPDGLPPAGVTLHGLVWDAER